MRCVRHGPRPTVGLVIEPPVSKHGWSWTSSWRTRPCLGLKTCVGRRQGVDNLTLVAVLQTTSTEVRAPALRCHPGRPGVVNTYCRPSASPTASARTLMVPALPIGGRVDSRVRLAPPAAEERLACAMAA